MRINIVLVMAVLAFAGCGNKKDDGGKAGDPAATKPATDKPAGVTHPSEDDCKKLQAHIFEITPESAAKLKDMSPEDKKQATDEFVAGVDAADIKQCTEGDKKVIDCMQAAPDTEKLRACIPQ